LKAIGMMRRARAELDASLAIAPHDLETLFEKMDFLLQAPAVAGGDKKKAPEIANEIMQLNAARGNLAFARIAWKRKEFDRLEGLYRKAADSDPRNYEALMALANLYLGNRTAPEDSNAEARANFSLAEQHARAALDLNSDRIDAYRALIAVMIVQKRWDDAAKIVTRAEGAIPDDLTPYVIAARGMLRQGLELPRAEANLRKYITQTQEPEAGAPLAAGAHWSLALVYEKEGRKADARSELETALRLKPDFGPAQRDLKRLK
jgi:tetratricopeptide (TPR) repeat protein